MCVFMYHAGFKDTDNPPDVYGSAQLVGIIREVMDAFEYHKCTTSCLGLPYGHDKVLTGLLVKVMSPAIGPTNQNRVVLQATETCRLHPIINTTACLTQRWIKPGFHIAPQTPTIAIAYCDYMETKRPQALQAAIVHVYFAQPVIQAVALRWWLLRNLI